jgi:uncharacterized membrane protein
VTTVDGPEDTGARRGDADKHPVIVGFVFYHNPQDPRLWVPRRSGLGYTLNIAHPKARSTLVAIFAVPAAAVVIATILSRH